MKKRRWIISLFCVGIIVGLGWKLDREWRQYAARNGPQALEVHALSGIPIPVALPAPDYTAIARQNPFHAERNDLIAEPVQTAKVTGPPPLVYGSLIFGSARAALLGTEQSPKPERVEEGSTFAGYRLVSVLPQSVVLESGAGREEIMFYNALERLHRQASKTSANARASSQTPAITSGGGQVPSPPAVANEPANSPVEPQKAAISARPAPSGKEWQDTPFGPMLFDTKKKP
jgi:hypothetical protein